MKDVKGVRNSRDGFMSTSQGGLFSRVLLVLVVFKLSLPAVMDGGSSGLEVRGGPARIGGHLVIDVSAPGAAHMPVVLALSPSLGPTMVSGFGAVCLGLDDPGFLIIHGGLDGFGRLTGVVAIPAVPSLTTLPPLFVIAAASPLGVLGVSETLRIEFENPDSYKPTVSLMTAVRANHTATSLYSGPGTDRRVFIAGGGPGSILAPVASQTTELFDPLTRSFSPGPIMSSARALHRSTLLSDGRVLITGGIDSTGQPTNSCDLYDPQTNTLVATSPMNVARVAHGISVMLDGRVMVTGGSTVYVAPGISLTDVTLSGTPVAEIFDPVLETWTTTPTVLILAFLFHTQTTLDDGRIFLWHGGSQIYCPLTQTWAIGPNAPFVPGFPLPGSFGCAATKTPDGFVLLTGGAAPPIGPLSPFFGLGSGAVYVFDGISVLPRLPLSLPNPGAFFERQVVHHQQCLLPDGRVVVMGGGETGPCASPWVNILSGSSNSWESPIGTNPGLASSSIRSMSDFSATTLFDGTILLAGGRIGPPPDAFFQINCGPTGQPTSVPTNTALIYTPPD